MINEHKLTLAILEATEPFYHNGEFKGILLEPDIIDIDYKIKFRITIIYHLSYHAKEYPIFRSWLETDPRTTLTMWSDLQIETEIDKGDYIITYRIQTSILPEEEKLLKDLGKLVENNYSMPAVAC